MLTATVQSAPGRAAISDAPPPGTLNLLIAAAQLGAALGIIFGLSRANAWWQVTLLIAGFVIVGNAMYFMVHEAQHRTLHPVRRVNDLVGTVLSLFFPAPFALLRRVHLAHHHANRSPDEAFDLYLPDDPQWWKRTQFYGLLTGAFYIVAVAGGPVLSLTPPSVLRRVARCDRQTSAVLRLMNERSLRWIRLQTAVMIVVHVGIIWVLAVPLPLYVLAYIVFGVTWSTMQYLHHYGTPIDRREGAVDLRPMPLLSWLWLYHHHHLTHHRHPRVPWTRLPELARRDGVVPTSMLRQYLRQWRGPVMIDRRQFKDTSDRPTP